jgi:hypothetical protein
MRTPSTPVAILLSSVLIALALTFGSRFQITPTSDGVALRIDRLTGNVDACPLLRTDSGKIVTYCDGKRH